jgi:hypothetical protein
MKKQNPHDPKYPMLAFRKEGAGPHMGEKDFQLAKSRYGKQ